MEAFLDFLKAIFTKIEVMLPTLIAAVSSCGGIFIYKLSTIIANVKALRDALKSSRDENETLRTQFILVLDTLDKLFDLCEFLIENNNNVKVKKIGQEKLKKIKRKDDIITVIPVVNTISTVSEAVKVKKIKVKKTKKVTQQ